MTQEHEREVVSCDFERMDVLFSRRQERLVYVDECNVFTIAHARAHGIERIEKYWDEYIVRLGKLNAKIIFLDVPVEVSWERRSKTYEQRLIYFPKKDHSWIMQRYREYLVGIRPLLHQVYERVPFPKKMIVASSSETGTLQQVSHALAHLSRTFQS